MDEGIKKIRNPFKEKQKIGEDYMTVEHTKYNTFSNV